MLTPPPTKRLTRPSAPNTPVAGEGREHVSHSQPFIEGLVANIADRDLADVLRRTTFHAHGALKNPHPDPTALLAVRAEVDGLQAAVDRLGLSRLRPFLDALRLRIEEKLNTPGLQAMHIS